MEKLRILLAEDHATVREGLKLIVNAQPDMIVVGEAADGHAAVAQAQALAPDVVVMDVSMPRLNGLNATEMVKQSCPHTRVLSLSRHAESGYVRELLRAGASGYVLKQSQSVEFLNAIRTVGSGGTYLDPRVANDVIGEYAKPRRVTGASDAPGGLTPREIEVVRMVAAGYSNKDIATRRGLSVKTIETHKANAMQKLGMTSRIDLVRFARLHGWLEADV